MGNDNELLKEYAVSASEAAFAELVHRHINMVYSAALRESRGNQGLAEELTQAVFLELSRKATELSAHPAVVGWLYTSVRWMAANARRAEDRRQQHHQEYQDMSELHGTGPDDSASTWRQVRPVLDDILHELDDNDRAAIVLRYFKDLNLRQVGEQLGVGENAARMRVDRALGRMHERLRQRGIVSTGSALAGALGAAAVTMGTAPSNLAATITSQAIRSAVAAKATVGSRLPGKFMLPKCGVIALVATAAIGLGTTCIHLFIRFHPALAQQLHHWLIR